MGNGFAQERALSCAAIWLSRAAQPEVVVVFTRHRLALLICLVSGVLTAPEVGAEPIRATYRAEVSRLCYQSALNSGPEDCREYRASFPVTLEFDTEGTAYETDTQRARLYSHPVLSAIPLPAPRFPPLPELNRQEASELLTFDGGEWRREAFVIIRHEGGIQDSSDGSEFSRDLALYAVGGFVAPPVLSAHSFVEFLGTAPSRYFALSFGRMIFGDDLSSYSEANTYYGTFSSVTATPDPVPEPASVVLLGTGLAAAVFRRRIERRVITGLTRSHSGRPPINAPRAPSPEVRTLQ
jgi:hypothetical protein